MENEPIPVSLALRAVERAIREHREATDTALYLSEPPAKATMAWISVARAGFRGALEYIRHELASYALEALLGGSRPLGIAVAPLIAHYDRVSPGWRTAMTEPEIDEAAAWAYASNHVATMERYYPIQHRTLGMQDTYNRARAALRWKARAEAAEAERDSLRRQLAQSVKAR